MTQSGTMVTSAQAAEILGKSVRTVHRMAFEGQLDVVAKLPGLTGAWLFNRADVERLAA